MALQPNKALAAAEARRLWSLYGFTSPAQLVLEDLAMALGIVVMDGRLDSAAARLVRTGNLGLVRVSQAIREPGRRRFAIAHEIGHWMLHAQVSHLLACTDSDMLGSYKSSNLEVEASIFAGNLLMPEHIFKREAGWPPTRDRIESLADAFGTTLTATALRYVETTSDYCIFVVSERNRIRWWRASSAFGDHELWIDNKTTLPPTSGAACYFRGDAVPSQPQVVDLRDWLGDLPSISGNTLLEQSIALPAYGQVLSLLWLP